MKTAQYLQHLDQGLRDDVQRELHFVKDFSDRHSASKTLQDDSLAI
jgi:hypothetical protein